MNINLFISNNKKIDHLAYVRALMALHDIKPADIARELNVSKSLISHCIRGSAGGSSRVRKYIAERLGMDFKPLWGKEEK